MTTWVRSFFPFFFLCALCIATGFASPAAPQEGKAQITILYDAFGADSAMQKDWGYSALVEYGGKRILFDTGNNPDTLARNVKVKGVDVSNLDFVVMSHRHGDHMGGLSHVLQVNPQVKIYAPKVASGFTVQICPVPFTVGTLPCRRSSVISQVHLPKRCDSAQRGREPISSSLTRTLRLFPALT